MKEQNKRLVLFITLCIFTFLVLFMALKINSKRLENLSSTSYINNYLTEIKYSSMDNMVIEQPNLVVYVSKSNDKKSKRFEVNFSKVIKKYNLENDIVYINLNNQNIVDQFYQNAPQIVIYKNAEVSEVIDCNTLKNKNAIINLLKERGVIND